MSIADPGANLGFSTGGAKDIGNFRENIKNNYKPQVSDITYEGIFYDYYFDTTPKEQAVQLFEPSYNTSTSVNPITGENEYFMSVGFNSNIKESDFKRKNLNLTVVIDISGSMNSPFNRYHYGGNKPTDDEYSKVNKIELACKVIAEMTKLLKDDDRLAVVVFNNEAKIAKPMRLVKNTKMKAIRKHIRNITANGGTNFYAGMQKATELYEDLKDADVTKYENRIIFITDAMPNVYNTSEHSMLGLLAANAIERIHTTVIGVGIDFNTELIKHITRVKGANYYSVHSYKDFKKRLYDEFDFMVTPYVFDLSLEFESDSYSIAKIIGSPEADLSTGEIMKINTLFPSPTTDGRSRGGLVLLKLNKLNDESEKISLKCSYKNREEKSFMNEKTITSFSDKQGNPAGIRKGVLLSRYVDVMHHWINNDDYCVSYDTDKKDDWVIGTGNTRIQFLPRSKWERSGTRLLVEEDQRQLFRKFKKHLKKEYKVIKDKDLKREIKLLDYLIDWEVETHDSDDED
jgi:Ca-activated chloride channel family protein